MEEENDISIPTKKVVDDTKYIYGFKGFNKDLTCRRFQFEVGKVFKHEGDLKICNKGFHYCLNLKDVSTYYSFIDYHRFFLVKAKFHNNINYNQSDKSVTDEIELIEEIPLKLIKEYQEYLKIKNSNPDDIFNLEEYKILQKTYPDIILGGSAALYLYGFKIKRHSKSSDIDVILPKYTRFELSDFKPEDNVTEVDNMMDSTPSGNDFDYVSGITIDGHFTLLDVKIDNKARFNIVTYKGFKYKVCPWQVIIEAKLKYTKNSKTGKKHSKDFEDMFNLKSLEENVLFNPLDKITKKYLNID